MKGNRMSCILSEAPTMQASAVDIWQKILHALLHWRYGQASSMAARIW